jgi:flagellar biosynthesis/type III secretory pathway M-ring protein FliF/YscJ
MPIQWFEMVHLPIWIIVTAAVGFVVLLAIAIVLIVLYRKRKRKMMENLTRPEEELIAP